MSKRDPRKRDFKKVHHCPVQKELETQNFGRQFHEEHNKTSEYPELIQVPYRSTETSFHLVNLMFNTLDVAQRLIFKINQSKTQLFLLALCLLFLMIIIL